MKTEKPSRLAAFTLLAVACLTIMVGCVIVPGLPTVAKELGMSEYAGWLVTTPSLGVVIFGPLAGRLIEKCGLRRSLLLGLFFYGLLGAAGMFLSGIGIVIADRLLLGGATALVMSAGTGTISELYEGHARLTMIARQGMAIELGGVIFLSIGGVLAALHWQAPFLLYLIAWLLAALVYCFVPHAATAQEPETNVSDTAVSGVLKLVYFAAAASMVVFFTAITALPIRFAGLGASETTTGYFLSFISLVAVGAAACMPRVCAWIGEFKTLALAFLFYAAAHVLFAVANEPALFVIGGVAMGCGFGLSIPLVNHMTVERSHVHQRARNLAYLSMAIFTGQFCSSFMNVVGADYRRVFAAAAILAITAWFGIAFAHRRLRVAQRPI